MDGDGYNNACDNCPFISNISQADSDWDGVGDACTFNTVTPIGLDVNIDLGTDVSVIYSEIEQEGVTTMSMTATGPDAISSLFAILPSAIPAYYNLSTDATYNGPIEICINYIDEGLTPQEEHALSLWHYQHPDWTKISTFRDAEINTICGVTNTLSPFVVAMLNFTCGDANGDEGVNIGDVVYLANYVFRESECATNPPIGCPPDPYEAGDANCDGTVNIGDAVYLGNVIFRPGSPEPCANCP